jgi:hypothetical protein
MNRGARVESDSESGSVGGGSIHLRLWHRGSKRRTRWVGETYNAWRIIVLFEDQVVWVRVHNLPVEGEIRSRMVLLVNVSKCGY